jgi:hypothetical protein
LLDLVDQFPNMLWGPRPKGEVVSWINEVRQPLLCLEDFGKNVIFFPFMESTLADLAAEKAVSIGSVDLIGKLQSFLGMILSDCL